MSEIDNSHVLKEQDIKLIPISFGIGHAAELRRSGIISPDKIDEQGKAKVNIGELLAIIEGSDSLRAEKCASLICQQLRNSLVMKADPKELNNCKAIVQLVKLHESNIRKKDKLVERVEELIKDAGL